MRDLHEQGICGTLLANRKLPTFAFNDPDSLENIFLSKGRCSIGVRGRRDMTSSESCCSSRARSGFSGSQIFGSGNLRKRRMNFEELVLKKEFPASLLFEAGFQRLFLNRRSGPHHRP
jgi:hypothetical protein